MSVITEGIRIEENSALSFGNYLIEQKIKINDFENLGDKYNLRSHNEMTRLQKNGGLLFESVPGSAVQFFEIDNKCVKFGIEGNSSTQITLELEPNTKYRIFIDDVLVDGSAMSNSSGKINFSLMLDDNAQNIKIEKI